MKKIHLLTALTLLMLVTTVEGQLFSNVHHILPVNNNSYCWIQYHTKDQSGNLIITGRFEGTIAFSGSNLTLNDSPADPDGWSNRKTFIAKLNSNGTWAWAVKTWSNNKNVYPEMTLMGLRTDADGNVVIAGYYAGTARLGMLSITANSAPKAAADSRGHIDMFVAKMNGSNGSFIWARSEGSKTGPDYPADIAIDAQNNVIVSGTFANSRATCNICYPAVFTADIYLVKYNSGGTKLWSKNMGNSVVVPHVSGGMTSAFLGQAYSNGGLALSTDAVNNIFLAGRFVGTVRFDSRTVNSRAAKVYDAFLANLSPGGVTQWVKTGYGTRNGTIGESKLDRLYRDANGSLYLGGGAHGTHFVFDNVSYLSANNFLMKANSAGTPTWLSKLSRYTNYHDWGMFSSYRNMATTASGNIYVLVDSSNLDDNPPTWDDERYFNAIRIYDNTGQLLSNHPVHNSSSSDGSLSSRNNVVTVSMSFHPNVTLETANGPMTINLPESQYWSSGIFIADYEGPVSALRQLIPTPPRISEMESISREVTLFPNPATQQISIRSNDGRQLGMVDIFDVSGKRVYRRLATAPMLHIDLQSLPAGQYFIKSALQSKSLPFIRQ